MARGLAGDERHCSCPAALAAALACRRRVPDSWTSWHLCCLEKCLDVMYLAITWPSRARLQQRLGSHLQLTLMNHGLHLPFPSNLYSTIVRSSKKQRSDRRCKRHFASGGDATNWPAASLGPCCVQRWKMLEGRSVQLPSGDMGASVSLANGWTMCPVEQSGRQFQATRESWHARTHPKDL